MRKLLHRFEHPWQADLFQTLLNREGIQSYAEKGAREYLMIVTGMGNPVTEVYVSETDHENAQKLLASYLRTKHLHLVEDPPEPVVRPENPFRKLVFFSVAGAIFLPVILNIYALVNLQKFLKIKEATLFTKFVAVMIVTAGWLGSLTYLFVIVTELLD